MEELRKLRALNILEFRNQILEEIDLPVDSTKIAATAAFRLYEILFGGKWIKENIISNKNISPLFSRPLRAVKEAEIFNIILSVAEGAYNLRFVNGFENVLSKIRDDNIISPIGEIEAGRTLKSREINFEYVISKGAKREDYDIRIELDSTSIACECKYKKESEEYSDSSIKNLINKAKKQLPIDKPSVVFIKYPSKWAGVENQKFIKNIKKLVDSTSRPFGVVCWKNKFTRLDSEQTLKTSDGFEIHNILGERIYHEALPFLRTDQLNRSWISFNTLFQ